MFAALNSFLTGALAKVTDVYWPFVSTLLHGDGTNAAQNNTFLDGSTNNFTVTRNGNTTQGSFNPFTPVYPYVVATNGGSGYFDGTGDYLSVPNNAAFSFSTGDFTIEMWVYPQSFAVYNTLIEARSVGTASSYGLFIDITTGKIYWFDASGVQLSSSGLTLNTWAHVAVSRTSGVLKLFIAGVQVYSAANTNAQNPTGDFVVGRNIELFSPIYFNGYISNLRVVNGTGLYTTTFTPPTAPLTAVTNTALLLGMSNGAIFDNTMLNNLETVSSAQISTSVFKYGTGSVALNGTTDYLNTSPANQAAFAFGSGDFTIEMWVYTTSVAGFTTIYDSYPTLTGGFYPSIQLALGQLVYGTNLASVILGSTLSANTWYHIAVARSGTSTKMFLNGTQTGSTYTDSNVYLNTSLRPYIGLSGYNGAGFFPGYIDDLRVTKGIARYTTTFTPPTAAFPNSGP